MPSTVFIKQEFYDPLSMSKKENLLPEPSKSLQRQYSDDFYDMLNTPGKPMDNINQMFAGLGQKKLQDSFNEDFGGSSTAPMFQIGNAMHISNFEKTPGAFSSFSNVGKVEQDSRVCFSMLIQRICLINFILD